MPLYHIFILALIQGLTEFLPISSSGHLVLTHRLLDGDITKVQWLSDEVTLDVAVHFGTLLSVLWCFRKDVGDMSKGLCIILSSPDKAKSMESSRLAFFVIAASLPVIIAGFILHILSPDWVRSVTVVAWTTLLFGLLLGIADRMAQNKISLDQMNLKTSLIIGLAQILSLAPGTSRSGITMTAARFCGFDRTQSARFSLLLAIIASAGASVLSGMELIRQGDFNLGIEALIATILAFLSGWLAITGMMRWLKTSSFMPFVIYRVLLGVALLAILYL